VPVDVYFAALALLRDFGLDLLLEVFERDADERALGWAEPRFAAPSRLVSPAKG
jgi:hypothetical protein